METVGQPWRGIDIEIPADRIRTVGLKRLERVHRIPLGLTHLLPVFVLHVTQNDNIFKGSLVKQQRRLRHQ